MTDDVSGHHVTAPDITAFRALAKRHPKEVWSSDFMFPEAE